MPSHHLQPRVVVLTGPSGAGKSRLAARLSARHGWPVVRLDDFYREGDDHDLPMLPMGIPDWDHPGSWRAQAAVDALVRLTTTGSAEVPVYDISTSRTTGSTTLTCGPGDVVLAEGIFAAEIVPALREHGILMAAYCVRTHRLVTFWRRLLRDLAERRKPPVVLWRRGLMLWRQEPEVVARHAGLGALPCSPAVAARRLDALRTGATVTAD